MSDDPDAAERSFATDSLHAGQAPDPATGARAPPLYQTTSYVFDDAEDAASQFALEKPGYIYSRLMNPTVGMLQERLAALEQYDVEAFDLRALPTTYVVDGAGPLPHVLQPQQRRVQQGRQQQEGKHDVRGEVQRALQADAYRRAGAPEAPEQLGRRLDGPLGGLPPRFAAGAIAHAARAVEHQAEPHGRSR